MQRLPNTPELRGIGWSRCSLNARFGCVTELVAEAASENLYGSIIYSSSQDRWSFSLYAVLTVFLAITIILATVPDPDPIPVLERFQFGYRCFHSTFAACFRISRRGSVTDQFCLAQNPLVAWGH